MRAIFRACRGRALAAGLVLCGLALGGAAEAQAGLEVTAVLSDAQAVVGDVVTLEVRAVATENGDVAIELPPFEGLEVLGRSQSTQMSMSWTSAGQRIRREKIVQVELAVEARGKLEIPPITARLGDQAAETEPLVLDASGEDPSARPVTPEAGRVVPPDSSEARLFVRYRLSQAEAWLGQQVFLDLEIFADPALGFQVDSIPDPPDLDGFWREVLERPKRLVPRAERLNGRRYQVFRAWRFALFPLQAGTRTLKPVSIGFRLGTGGVFGGVRRARRRTRALELEVKPLPEAGRPDGFESANVGAFSLTARVEDPEVRTGKAVVLKVSLSGEGNVKSAQLPELPALDDFRVFPPTIEEEVDLRPSGVEGTKTAEVLLVPQKPGTYAIPALELPVFDPREGAYEVLRTDPIEVRVQGEPVARSEPPPAPSPPDRPAPEDERRPLRVRAELERPPSLPWTHPAWWAALLAGPLAWAGTWGARRAGAGLRSRREDPRREREAAAEQKLEDLRAKIEAEDPGAAAAAFMDALHARAELRLGASLRSRTADEIAEALREAGAEPSYAREVAEALDRASFARYAGGAEPLEDAGPRWVGLVEGLDALDAETNR